MVFGKMNIFQAGILFPSVSGSALCLTNGNDIKQIEIEHIKKEIICILDEKKNVSISYLSEELNYPPRKIVSALKELEEEGIIREA